MSFGQAVCGDHDDHRHDHDDADDLRRRQLVELELLQLVELVRLDKLTLSLNDGNLLREVWGFRAMGRTRTLDSHASRVRRKLAAHTEMPYVINEWGVG